MASDAHAEDTNVFLREMDVEALRELALTLQDQPGLQVMAFQALRAIYEHTNSDDDLDMAIRAVERLSPSTATGDDSGDGGVHGDALAQLQEEASGLARKLFERTLAEADLARARALIESAVECTPDDGGAIFARRMQCLSGILNDCDRAAPVRGESVEHRDDPVRAFKAKLNVLLIPPPDCDGKTPQAVGKSIRARC